MTVPHLKNTILRKMTNFNKFPMNVPRIQISKLFVYKSQKPTNIKIKLENFNFMLKRKCLLFFCQMLKHQATSIVTFDVELNVSFSTYFSLLWIIIDHIINFGVFYGVSCLIRERISKINMEMRKCCIFLRNKIRSLIVPFNSTIICVCIHDQR